MQISLNSVCLTFHDSCFSYLCTFFDTLTTLCYWSSEDWNPGDKIQMLSTEMKQRFGKEMSEISSQLLCMIKQVSQLFKELHEGKTNSFPSA